MTKHKHLSFDERLSIESMLSERKSFRFIANELSKDPSTISKEVKQHLIFRRIGSMRISYNACIHCRTCNKSHICSECHADRHYSLCHRCAMCNRFCKDFQQEICSKLLKPPYSATDVLNEPTVPWKNGSTRPLKPTRSTALSSQSPDPASPFLKKKYSIWTSSSPL